MSSEEKIKFEEEQAKATRTWLLSFIDLLSLVLAFFVLMYSTRDLSQQQYFEIKDSFVEYVNGQKGGNEYKYVNKQGSTTIIKSAQNLNYLETLFRNSLIDNEAMNIKLIRGQNRIIAETMQDYTSDEDFIIQLTEKLIILSKTINTLSNQLEVVVESSDIEESKKLSEMASAKMEELGFEYRIFRTLPAKNFVSENVEKNKKSAKIQVIINNYESVF